jgi:hypothetical protein
MNITHSKDKNSDSNIIMRRFSGKVCVDDIINSWQEIERQQLICKDTIGVINDLRDCELCLDMNGFKELMAFLQEQDYLTGLKLSVVTSKPAAIIFPIMAEIKQTNFMVKAFSDIDESKNWILS